MYTILRDLLKLRKNLHINYDELIDNQMSMTRNIIKHAYANSYFYKNKFDEAHIKPNNINRLEDISKIPFTKKEEIQRMPLNNIISNNYDINNAVIRSTSGSTGIPLVVYVNKGGVSIDSAVWLRALFENGLKLLDKVAVLPNPNIYSRMINQKKTYQKLGIMRRKYINVLDDPQTQLSLLEKYKPNIIRSYPSYLTVLLNEKNRLKNVKPRSVFTTAELLDSESRKLITNSFDTELFDYYASEEFNLIAWECSEHSGYHVNIDNLLVEIVSKHGESLPPGEQGEIVITSLSNYAMPMIRYKIGDVGKIVEDKCSCGVTFPLLQVLEGRKDDFLISPNGSIISPRTLSDIFQYSLRTSLGINQFKIIQEKINMLKIYLVVDNNYDKLDTTLAQVEKEVKKVLSNEVNIEYVFVDKIKQDTSGKLRKIISHVHPSS